MREKEAREEEGTKGKGWSDYIDEGGRVVLQDHRGNVTQDVQWVHLTSDFTYIVGVV